MKKLIAKHPLAFILLFFFPFMQGCLKDTSTKTFTLFVPVYHTLAEVTTNIKSSTPVAVKNPGKIFIQGNYIFLNEIDKGVHIIDNTNPASPVNKFFVAIPGNLDLAVKGDILYADSYRNLVTLDISNPTRVQVKKITETAFLSESSVLFLLFPASFIL